MQTRVIHVIKPTGARFQFDFANPDPTTGRPVDLSDGNLLRVLATQRRMFGTVADKPVRNAATGKMVPHEDRGAGDWWDHPDLVVAEVNPDGTERTRLRGPQPVADAAPPPAERKPVAKHPDPAEMSRAVNPDHLSADPNDPTIVKRA